MKWYSAFPKSLRLENHNQMHLNVLPKTLVVLTPTGTPVPSQSGPWSNDNDKVLHIPQSSKTGASPSDSLALYLGYSLRSFQASKEMQTEYSTALVDWAKFMLEKIISNI